MFGCQKLIPRLLLNFPLKNRTQADAAPCINPVLQRTAVCCGHTEKDISSREMVVLVYTAIFEKNMRNSTVNYLIPDWLTAVT